MTGHKGRYVAPLRPISSVLASLDPGNQLLDLSRMTSQIGVVKRIHRTWMKGDTSRLKVQ
jgi:hypothetical protein